MKDSKLFRELQKLEEEQFGKDLHPITTNILFNLEPVAAKLLETIPAYMPEYTLHNIDHCKAILDNISFIIPQDVKLNIVELTILIHAVILHDIGMVINTIEAEKIKNSNEFAKLLLEYDKGVDEKEILTEFIRRTHVQRSLEYIDKFKAQYDTYKIDFNYKGIDLSDWIKNVIESHGLLIEKLKDSNKYPTKRLISKNNHVNIQYLSILLRLGDILDFDVYRTPPFLYKHINPQNKISNDEWKKHLSIEGTYLNETKIEFHVKCLTAKIERSVRNFIGWIELERKESMTLLEDGDSNYRLKLKEKVSHDIRNDGSYVYSDLELNLDYNKVLNILMGTELYDSPDVFVRELLQNAYDACNYRQELLNNVGENYESKISIKYDSITNILEINDNGIGIDDDTLKNFVLKIGNSFYKSKSFEKENLKFNPISNFGIGILSCFMVSDVIEIKSLKYQNTIERSTPIHCILHVNEQYIDMRKGEKQAYGTTIKLRLHKEYHDKLTKKSIIDIIKESTAHQLIPIKVNIDGKETILNDKSIDIPKEYEDIDDILRIKIEKISWLEGFIIIHQGQHQQIISRSKISQQGFTITSKNGGSIIFEIKWLRFTRLFINILPENKLSLKASRNGIRQDEKFLNLKNTIIEVIIDFFLQSENEKRLPYFLDDGRVNVFSKNEKEYNFLIDKIQFILIKTDTLEQFGVNFKDIMSKCNKEQNSFIVIMPILYNFYMDDDQLKSSFINQIRQYDYVIISNHTIHYFIQFAQPLTLRNEIIISNLKGLVYNQLIIARARKLSLSDYDLNYSWVRDYDLVHEKNYNNIFCIVGNNQYNSIDLKFNYNHILGALLKVTKDESYTKRFKGSLKTHFAVAIRDKITLKSYAPHNGESWIFLDNNFPFSINTIGFITINFLETLNHSLKNDLLIPLSELGYLRNDEIDNYLLSQNNFPHWWIDTIN